MRFFLRKENSRIHRRAAAQLSCHLGQEIRQQQDDLLEQLIMLEEES